MKNAILVSLMMILTVKGFAEEQQRRVILQDSKTMQAEVSTNTVRCTHIGYGSAELKINLAGLDGWTLFDHTNSHVGEFGEPCMTAGRCKVAGTSRPGFTIDSLIQNNPGVEAINVKRVVTEVKQIMKDINNVDVCERHLEERLDTVIRGIPFKHTRTGANQTFPLEACQKK